MIASCVAQASGEITHVAKITIYICVGKSNLFLSGIGGGAYFIVSNHKQLAKICFQKSLSSWDPSNSVSVSVFQKIPE